MTVGPTPLAAWREGRQQWCPALGQREFTFASIRAGKLRAAAQTPWLPSNFNRRGYIVLHRESGQQSAGPSQAPAE
jgi:hypothetical protein